jgi:CheY-like chemotaxis protein
MSVHVLVVDDDDDVREILQLALEAEGFEVVTAADGRQALQCLERLPPPRVMVLDLLMPVLNGWQTIEALRAQGRLRDVPIIICTSAPDKAPPGFPVLAKPVELNQLVQALERTSR